MTDTNETLILSIDAGTQSMRAGFVDLKGNIVHQVKNAIEPYFSVKPGWAEQKPEYYWEMLCKTCQELLKNAAVDTEKIAGVCLTTQRATVINVDAAGKPLRPAILWLDQRKADASAILPNITRPALKLLGLDDFLEGVIATCQINWLKQNQMDVWQKTHKYLLLSGYLNYKLTGEFSDSVGSNVGYLPINNKTYQWAGKYDFKWKIFPIEPEKLPHLIKPGQILGEITKEASLDTGLPEGIPVIAAASDKACEILGAGCLTPEKACLSFGTIATINTAIKKYVEVLRFYPPYPAAVPDEYYTEISIMRGFWMVSWFKEEFGYKETVDASKKGVSPEMLFDRMIRDIPPGSMGLVLHPHWSPGPSAARYTKGSIIGFGDVHTRAHVYRAILEGLIFGLKEGALVTEKKNKVPITRLRISGGGSQSNTAMQIAADIFGVPAERPHTHETSMVGAAIDGAIALEYYPDFETAVQEMCRVKEVFEPQPGNQQLYQELFDKVYSKISSKLLPLFKDIQEITGYPG